MYGNLRKVLSHRVMVGGMHAGDRGMERLVEQVSKDGFRSGNKSLRSGR